MKEVDNIEVDSSEVERYWREKNESINRVMKTKKIKNERDLAHISEFKSVLEFHVRYDFVGGDDAELTINTIKLIDDLIKDF